MDRVIVRYRTKPEAAAENVELIKAVFAALAEQQPEGLRYASFQLADGVSFVHLAEIDTALGPNPLSTLPEFEAFTRDIAARCDEPPAPQAATLVGSYRLWD